MIAAVCVDDRNGMLFNKRRLSRDQAQQQDLLALCGGKNLWIHSFSAKLFADYEAHIIVDDCFLQNAGDGEICFVENQPLQPWLERLDGLILYRWNRVYPSDQTLDMDLSVFACKEREEFSGTSHETITREIYIKK